VRYDFAFFFVVATALTGGIWLLDSLLFARGRRKAIADERAALDMRMSAYADNVNSLASTCNIRDIEITRNLASIGIRVTHSADTEKLRALMVRDMPELDITSTDDGLEASPRTLGQARREPVLVEYSRSFFPVILIILLVRSFLGEPYRIPSGSMMPTLLIGDFILVNKFAYGLRLPVLDTKIVPIGEPARGDVVVFHPPHHPEQAWIKRVIGLPGDTIAYDNYILTINGQPVSTTPIGPYVGKGSGRDMTGWRELRETLPERSHRILQQDLPPMFQRNNGVWKVPPNEYFMMGDNRDNSEDSRFWPTNFLPEKNIVGKAVVVWMNWDTGGDGMDSSRIGTVIK